MSARDAFELLDQPDLITVHHALRQLARFPSESDEATRLADIAWAINCDRSAESRAREPEAASSTKGTRSSVGS